MFNVNVYASAVRGGLRLANWSDSVSGLRFASEAFGGFASCSFILKKDYQTMLDIVEGLTNSPTYVGNRISITDPAGICCYEGKIHTLTLRHGNAMVGRSLDELYNIARFDYTVRDKTRQAGYYDSTSRALFGNRVYYETLDGSFPNGTNPLARATRLVTIRKAPSKAPSDTLGGDAEGLQLEVDCVGMSEELNVRYAWNNRGIAYDTGQIVKDMLQAGSVTSGTGAWRGQNGWHEMTHSTGGADSQIPYVVQEINSTTLTNIATTGVTVASAEIGGQSRWDIIKAAAAFGNSNNIRMLFQVWEIPNRRVATATNKPLVYFVAQPTTRGNVSGYTGYFCNTRTGVVFDSNGDVMDLWNVRAGQWMTRLNLPKRTYTSVSSVFDDPRMQWLERVEYDADSGTLTMSADNDYSAELLLAQALSPVVLRGNIGHGKRI